VDLFMAIANVTVFATQCLLTYIHCIPSGKVDYTYKRELLPSGKVDYTYRRGVLPSGKVDYTYRREVLLAIVWQHFTVSYPGQESRRERERERERQKRE
jgi:hypothetical protein